MRSVCEDLNMRFVDSISLDIMDLKCPEKRDLLKRFAETLIYATEKQSATSCFHRPLTFKSMTYQPEPAEKQVETKGKKVLVLTDRYDPNTNLGKMIDRFRQSFSDPVELMT